MRENDLRALHCVLLRLTEAGRLSASWLCGTADFSLDGLVILSRILLGFVVGGKFKIVCGFGPGQQRACREHEPDY